MNSLLKAISETTGLIDNHSQSLGSHDFKSHLEIPLIKLDALIVSKSFDAGLDTKVDPDSLKITSKSKSFTNLFRLGKILKNRLCSGLSKPKKRAKSSNLLQISDALSVSSMSCESIDSFRSESNSPRSSKSSSNDSEILNDAPQIRVSTSSIDSVIFLQKKNIFFSITLGQVVANNLKKF